MIIIKNDGTIEPFGLYWLRDSRLPLVASTRDIKDESDEFDGEMDFGTDLTAADGELRCVTDEGLSKKDIINKKSELAVLFNVLREGDYLMYESDPDKKIFVRLSGRVEIQDMPSWFRVHIPIKWGPLWFGVSEKEHTGNGLIKNGGSFDTPLIIEVRGIVTDPEIIVGDDTLLYQGTLGETDLLVIDTDKQTVMFNGVNAAGLFEGSFPNLQPGETEVQVPVDGETKFKWRDCWV